MKSLRLEAVSKLVKNDSSILDVGTDHAYLPLLLMKQKKCKSIIASDISINALNAGKENLKKHNIKGVKFILSDGLRDIKEKYDTLVICGMGTSTIIHILESGKLPDNIIISSNNDLYMLRKYMNDLRYKIVNEIVVYENKKYYDILSYEKGYEKLSHNKLMYGISNNKNYFKYLYKKEKYIFIHSKKLSTLKNMIYLYFKSI